MVEKGKPGEIYNIGGGEEKANIDVVKGILQVLGKPESRITYVKDRPGHDWRYALDTTKIESEVGWKPTVSLEEGLARTVNWYLQNKPWWRRVRGGSIGILWRSGMGGTHKLFFTNEICINSGCFMEN